MSELSEYQTIIDDLNGSSSSLHQALARHDREDLEDNTAFLEQLDDQLFKCASCDWWCETSEAHAGDDGDDVCDDCHADGDC